MRKSVIIIVSAIFIINSSILSFAQSIDVSHVASDIGAVVASGTMGKAFSGRDLGHFISDIQPPLKVSVSDVMSPGYDRDAMSVKIAAGVMALSDARTHVAPSHLGHPGYQDAAFVYDKAVDALILHAAGRTLEAKALLDYFAQRLRIPMKDVRRNADANGIYGMLKLFPSTDDPKVVSLVNAVNCRSMDESGQGQVEYWTTPGPLAFMVLAFLTVDRKQYLQDAIKVGQAILAMQRADGAITDGDRDARNVHTEPHMDSYSAFLMLYDVTGDEKWKAAAERAWAWFVSNVYRPDQHVIYQGIRPAGPSEVFATDTYSWTIAGRGGDRLPLNVIEALMDRMLRRSVSQVTLELPDGKTKTLTLVDFADVQDMRITADRGGFHPMGSVEWIGGVILALQKSAVRFENAGDEPNRTKAKFYKALAEYFTQQAVDSFYEVDGVAGVLSFYATGQWTATGHGWKTPYFYVKDPDGKPVIKGGSTISSWPVLPLKRVNPFMLDDPYGQVYDRIVADGAARQQAAAYVTEVAAARAFMESVPAEMASDVGDIPEMWRYNARMFQAFEAGDYYAAILWAQKVVGNSEWVKMAADQQARKARDIGGLVEYTWGSSAADAKESTRLIQKYPLLNEMGTAMWGMAVSQFKLGNRNDAKSWIKTLIETVPLHQIFAPSGPGYWSAIISWEDNPGGTVLDAEMGEVYREVLAEMGRTSAIPKIFAIK
ncbi:MAG: AGE family epimerase/isomerase [Candidatus Omnitrophica bacterium]|nr:AGE family epimerase/isomerase [Candidatus Omnitrophota bacterium]